MLRELADALDTLTQTHPLVLVLEDMHWSDAATLDLLAALAQRPEPARLLVLCTYRPVEVIVHRHPLKALTQALEVHHQCTELPLEWLSAAEVAQYLAARFAVAAPLAAPFAALARTLHERTDGQPLFLVTMVDDLVRQGLVRQVGGQWMVEAGSAAALREVPASLQRMLAQWYDELPALDQQVLDAASVAGLTWSAAAVAAGLGVDVEAVEVRCAALVRRGQWLDTQGLETWPDGTVAERYCWQHTLYQEVVYERLSAGQRVRLHRRLGDRWQWGTVPRRRRTRPSWPSTMCAARTLRRPCTTSSRRPTRPSGAMPIRKRSPPCGKGWRCWRPSPRARRAPGTNSRSCCSWGRA
jgi:predicted ATPase